TISGGSLMAMFGVQRQSTMAILTCVSVLVMMQKRVISEAVPAVVLMARKEGIGLVDLLTPSKSRILPPLPITSPTPLPQSWELPPPRETMPSHLFSWYTFTPAWTFLSVGLGSAPSKMTPFRPASSSWALILAATPILERPASVTIRRLVAPSALA